MSDSTTEEPQLEEETPIAEVEVKTIASGSSIPLKPIQGDVEVDFSNSNRETLKPRRSRNRGKLFTDGFKIPGFNAYHDLPGKVCVNCGFRALRFSTQCSKCGGELVPEPEEDE